MKHKLTFNALLVLALFLTLTPIAFASTTWYVNGVTGSDKNDCMSSQNACKTISHAISLASSGDTIMVAAATYTENIFIGISLSVLGVDARATIIDGGGRNRVVYISNPSAHVTLSRMTIRNGLAVHGGGVYNVGTLTINNSTVSNNATPFIMPGLPSGAGAGGGIYNGGTLTINNSTVSGNYAVLACIGSGIYNASGLLAISNSTISGNLEYGGVGGIYNYIGHVTLQNSIVANGPTGANCSGAMTSHGYNLSSDNTCNFSNSGDRNNIDPKVGPLLYNGGPTQTMALPSGSPAIDAGNPKGCTNGQGHLLTTDQRGKPRPNKEDASGCDMGAYESQSD